MWRRKSKSYSWTQVSSRLRQLGNHFLLRKQSSLSLTCLISRIVMLLLLIYRSPSIQHNSESARDQFPRLSGNSVINGNHSWCLPLSWVSYQQYNNRAITHVADLWNFITTLQIIEIIPCLAVNMPVQTKYFFSLLALSQFDFIPFDDFFEEKEFGPDTDQGYTEQFADSDYDSMSFIKLIPDIILIPFIVGATHLSFLVAARVTKNTRVNCYFQDRLKSFHYGAYVLMLIDVFFPVMLFAAVNFVRNDYSQRTFFFLSSYIVSLIFFVSYSNCNLLNRHSKLASMLWFSTS